MILRCGTGVLVLFFVAAFVQEGRSGDEEAQIIPLPLEIGLEPDADDDATQFVAVPIPILNPTLGAGVALAGISTFELEENSQSPRSTLALVGVFTDTDSWMLGAGGKAYFGEDRYRLTLAAGYGSFNFDYYGRNSDSVFFDRPLAFALEGSVLSGSGLVRISDNLYGGLSARLLQPKTSLNTNFDRISNLQFARTLNGVGPLLEFDTRDDQTFPTSGDNLSLEVLFYDEAVGSDFDFTSWDSFWHRYRLVDDDLVLAAELRAAQATQDAPFFMLPFVSFRGFPAGQYLGESVLQVQGELRWQTTDELGLVTFAGGGGAMADAWVPGTTNWAWGAGAGARYLISEPDELNIGVDLAYGSTGDVTAYFRVGEAF